MDKIIPVALGATLAITGYTVSIVSMVYWLTAPLSLYGRLLYMILGIAVMAFLMLAALAYFYGDARILLTHHNRSGRRLFCCTLCPSASPDDSVGDDTEGMRDSRAAGWALRWDRLSQTEVMFLLGINNGILSVMGVSGALAFWCRRGRSYQVSALAQFFATPPTREPPLIGSLLASLSVVAAIPLSKYSLSDRKRYVAAMPLLAVALILASTVVSLLPALLQAARGGSLGGGAEAAGDVLAWTLIVAAVQVPTAMANVSVQAYMGRAGAERRGGKGRGDASVQAYLGRAGAHLPGEAGRRASAVGVFRFVFYNQAFVLATVAALFWVDLLPWFGSSASLEEVRVVHGGGGGRILHAAL